MSSTRLNVYVVLARFYLIRDKLEARLNLPQDRYDIPFMIQDKIFNSDRSLSYAKSVIIPDTPLPGFIGNTIAVNRKLWTYSHKYRLRFVNGSNERNYNLSLSNNASFHQIGTAGGFLPRPNEIKSFSLYPGERM